MAKRKTILGIPKCGQPTSCAPYAPPGCSVSYSPCCKSEVVVAGDGQTHWYSCARCGGPCDPLTASVSGILAHLSNCADWIKVGDIANALIRAQEAYNGLRAITSRKQNPTGQTRPTDGGK